VSIAEELGVDYEPVVYRRDPPDEATLREIIAKLEDPPTDLVRRDSLFKKLELSEDDVQTVDQVVATILANKMIMQRPVVVTADTAIVGRPKERVAELLAPLTGKPS
jgi:arsenate reductase